MILPEKLFNKIERLQQAFLLKEIDIHDPLLTAQILNIDEALFARQQALLKTTLVKRTGTPYTQISSSGTIEDQKLGEKEMRDGKCSCLILAGGQGSRLRFEGPKGCIPLSLIKQKTLFQLHFEKIQAATQMVQHPLQVAVMTSPLNHEETLDYFEAHNFFGVDRRFVHFFSQEMWPLLDFDGRLFLESPHSLAKGPNGNGGVFRCLVKTGLWQHWHTQGIEWVNVISVDNPLAAPFDAELFGFHKRLALDVSIKATRKSDPQEQVGVLVEEKGRVSIVEYSELSEEDKQARDPLSHELLFSIANLGMYNFSMPFILKASTELLPLHVAKKAVKKLQGKESLLPALPNAWKFEEYIFDVLPLALRTAALLFPREECFAPLKNLEGKDSIQSVQEALLARDRRLYTQISGTMPPKERLFELSQTFHYPSESLREQFRGTYLPPHDYIEEL